MKTSSCQREGYCKYSISDPNPRRHSTSHKVCTCKDRNPCSNTCLSCSSSKNDVKNRERNKLLPQILSMCSLSLSIFLFKYKVLPFLVSGTSFRSHRDIPVSAQVFVVCRSLCVYILFSCPDSCLSNSSIYTRSFTVLSLILCLIFACFFPPTILLILSVTPESLLQIHFATPSAVKVYLRKIKKKGRHISI